MASVHIHGHHGIADAQVDVDIIRLGEEDNACSVCFETIDVSATAGVA